MEPTPPSYNEAVENPHHYTSTSIDFDDESEEHGSSVDALRDEAHGAENSQFDEDTESNALLESEDASQRNISPGTESYFGTGGSSYVSGESQLSTSGYHSVSGEPPQTRESPCDIPSGSGAPLQTGESENRTPGNLSGSGTPSLTGESQYRTTGSSSVSGAQLETTESENRTTGNLSGSGPPPHTGESQYITTGSPYVSQTGESQYRTYGSSSGSGTPLQTGEVQSTSPAQPELSESSAQIHPPPPSYSEAFVRPGPPRNIMQISRSALSGAHRNPIIDPEQPPPPYSAVVSSQGSQYYPPVHAPILNSAYATQPYTSGINRYPAERTYGSGAQGSYNKQGYQRMPHGSYIPVIRNSNEQSGLTALSTGAPGNVQGYNTTPLAYVDPNSVPQEKTNTCGKLCTLCVCVALIFVPLIIYLMLLN